MGVTNWRADFQDALIQHGFHVDLITDAGFSLVYISGSKVVVNCLSIINPFGAEQTLALQKRLLDEGYQVINLWEDVWRTGASQVLNRIRSLCGQNIRIHGRKSKIISLTKPEADNFLSAFHIQGAALARYKYGLQYEGELIAVATFSGTRIMRQQVEGYRSAELIRFATKTGYTVTGGLTKLIRHFASQVKSNDIMSYADRDWSTGKGYEAAGFTFQSLIPPAELWVDTSTYQRYFKHRVPSAGIRTENLDGITAESEFVKIFNTGNLKYILYL